MINLASLAGRQTSVAPPTAVRSAELYNFEANWLRCGRPKLLRHPGPKRATRQAARMIRRRFRRRFPQRQVLNPQIHEVPVSAPRSAPL